MTIEHFTTIENADLATITGGKDDSNGKKPGPIKKCVYGALVAGTIALGSPGGQRHDDKSAGPLHSPRATSTSQCK